jgi:hypothetical protein
VNGDPRIDWRWLVQALLGVLVLLMGAVQAAVWTRVDRIEERQNQVRERLRSLESTQEWIVREHLRQRPGGGP